MWGFSIIAMPTGSTASTVKKPVARQRLAHNYAHLNRRGFSTSKLLKAKKSKVHERHNSLPNSPELAIIPNIHTEQDKKQKKKRVKKTKNLNAHEHDNWPQVVHDILTHFDPDKEGANALSKALSHSIEVNASLNTEAVPNHSIIADPSMTTLEEKKAKLKAEIKELEKLVEQEEDEELRQLVAKQQELKRKLSTRSGRKQGNKARDEEVFQVNDNTIEQLACDFDTKIKEKLPSLAEMHDFIRISDKKPTHKRSSCKRGSRRHRSESSDTSTDQYDSETSDWGEDSSSEEDRYRKKKRGKKKQSGPNAKAPSSRIISDEMYVHLALEDEVASNRDLRNISFNLLVAGELEIISDKKTKEKEKATRIKLLKHLAYKHEFLS